MENNQIWQPYKINLFIVWKGIFSIQNITKHNSQAYFAQVQAKKKFQILDQTCGLLKPVRKIQFGDHAYTAIFL